MVKKTCEKELNEIQKLKLENKQLRDKNSKLSNFIKHNRHKLTNPNSADEIVQKCSDEMGKPHKKNNNSHDNDLICPKCNKKKFLEKRLAMPNKTILHWKQCTDQSCLFKSEVKVEKINEENLSFTS